VFGCGKKKGERDTTLILLKLAHWGWKSTEGKEERKVKKGKWERQGVILLGAFGKREAAKSPKKKGAQGEKMFCWEIHSGGLERPPAVAEFQPGVNNCAPARKKNLARARVKLPRKSHVRSSKGERGKK